VLLSKQQPLDIIIIFQYYKFDLIESSDRFICFCPFHNDKNTPNLTIYPSTDSFYCFTCKACGDALTLISFMEKMPIKKVKEELGTSFIRMKLTHTYEKPVEFYNDLLKETSAIFYDAIHTHPDKLDVILHCMKMFEDYLNSIILDKIIVDFKMYVRILDNLKKLMYNSINKKV